jgi:hypothetical protein
MRIVYNKNRSPRRHIFSNFVLTHRTQQILFEIKTIDKRNNGIKVPVADHR